jgi:hypothetical protein
MRAARIKRFRAGDGAGGGGSGGGPL